MLLSEACRQLLTKQDQAVSNSAKKESHTARTGFAIALFLLVGGVLGSLLRNLNFATYATDMIQWLRSNLSVFRVTLIVGFGGSLFSIPFIRRRGRDQEVPANPVKIQKLSPNKGVHPLLMIQRPSRDTKFVIRKTRKKGRISRNRGGERLPAPGTE
jgi:hypothetical protein